MILRSAARMGRPSSSRAMWPLASRAKAVLKNTPSGLPLMAETCENELGRIKRPPSMPATRFLLVAYVRVDSQRRWECASGMVRTSNSHPLLLMVPTFCKTRAWPVDGDNVRINNKSSMC